MCVLGLRSCSQAFSSCGKQGQLSSSDAQASHGGGFSCCRAQGLGTQASAVAASGLSTCDMQALEYRDFFSSCGT